MTTLSDPYLDTLVKDYDLLEPRQFLIAAQKLHRHMNGLEETLHCPECGTVVEEKPYCVTQCDHEGEPVEREGKAFYCSTEECRHSVFGLEEDDCF